MSARSMAMGAQMGWSVEISRKNGPPGLAYGTMGVMPVVFSHRCRHLAVQFKRELKLHGLSARVVPVRYTEPKVVKGARP